LYQIKDIIFLYKNSVQVDKKMTEKKNNQLMKNSLALITGATSGIGLATARLFAEHGINLIVCGRRQERLQSLREELKEKVNIHHLKFDISSRNETREAFQSLPPEIKGIDFLINNAGNAHGLESIDKADINDFEKMLDINVKGLLYVSKEIIPNMVKRQKGHIVNIGSIAGKEVYPNGNVYCASKFAVDALSKAMRIDLYKYNIKVSAVNPGLVQTEFSEVRFKGDKERAAKVYQGYQPLKAVDIAETIFFIITRPPHVNLADTLILPTAQASSTLVNKES
jgi:NADP-dependent 3-hydroxy acid dehydrogenase YdfG